MTEREPVTREQWQEAVDAANAVLTIDAARQYGLITGGPLPDYERCEQIIERGKAMGITPRPGSAEALALAWNQRSRDGPFVPDFDDPSAHNLD